VVKRYLDLVSLDEAHATIARSFAFEAKTEHVPLDRAAGRITATPIFARFSVPELHLSAMDGIAVHSADTVGAGEQRPVTLGEAALVNTGNLVPPGFDAVVMIEDVQREEERYTIRAPVSPWQHIRPVGEDIGESEMILPADHRIRPHEIGALAAYGVAEVEVLSLSVGLIPTGSELVPVGTRPGPGQVVESNMPMASAILRDQGAHIRHYPICPDEPAEIRAAIEKGVRENDMLVISAGSSKGTRDYTASIIAELGEVFIHGIAIKPARPAIIGRIDGKPVIGMPGYPLAAYTILREILCPMVARYGLTAPEPETIRARLTTTLHSEIGTDEFVLLAAGRIGDAWVTVPQSRGAGVQMSAVRANACMRIRAAKEGATAGEEVAATLMVPRRQAEEAVLVTGSHDPALDHLANLVRRENVEVHSTHAGSMGGILALKKNECHAAPMHLLAAGGEYNLPFLTRYLPGEELVLLCVAERQQGIVSREGLGLDVITDHRFANRQKGSGTRMLLDHLLNERGIEPARIAGYDRELTTHLSVALAVKTGEADLGMCVYSAAKALDLPFVPVATERYELVAKKATLDEDARVRNLFASVASDEFKAILTRLGGYEITATGERRELP
jgi:molybdenum cofactor synthesis domain-containing protein